MGEPSLVLHVGAPKCGSSALQTALTQNPDLRSATGREMRYIALRQTKAGDHLIRGRMVRRLGRMTAYGYACWPNLGRHTDSAPIFQAMGKALHQGQRGGWLPILSCEGWINHPESFAAALAEMGNPRVDVVCFLRPPAEWVNAAWWQWGVWAVRSVDVWQNRGFLPYGFADHLERWARIPGVRLHVRRSRPDAVQKFTSLYDCALTDRVSGNASSPASLIGFLVRNRRFRETPHNARSEFIFQRWCPKVPGRPLWALAPRHIHYLRPVTRQARDTLQRVLSAEDVADVFEDLRWNNEDLYHDAILGGASALSDPADLPTLYAALAAGVAAASAAAGQKLPELPAPLDPSDPVARWDPVLAEMFECLIAADARWRRSRVLEVALRLREAWQGFAAKSSS